MSRTVIWLVVAGAIVIAAGLGVAWRSRQNEQAVLDQATRSTPAVQGAEGRASSAAAPPAAPSAGPAVPGAASTSAPAAADAPLRPAPLPVPTFDIVRIAPDGRAVVAGRASPGAKIVLLDGGKEIAHGETDSRGEWVVILQDPALAPGHHELRAVQHVGGRAPVTSDQVVIAVVPGAAGSEPQAGAAGASASDQTEGGKGHREQTLVMISPSSGQSTLVQAPSPGGVPQSADLAISAVDYDDKGNVSVSGLARKGTTVRIYIDDKLAAEGVTGADGRWRVTAREPVSAGKHTLRLDRLAADGKPVARLELPFERLEVPPSMKNVRRLVVVRGDNLWNIARAHYGAGYHHTVIYGANKEQIGDPNLIYPGQVFTIPEMN
ncbi:MAG: LysM peptidoglycan-binding domain-containing protein [Pseudomonadota bacterium]